MEYQPIKFYFDTEFKESKKEDCVLLLKKKLTLFPAKNHKENTKTA